MSRILVIDEDSRVLTLMRQLLQGLGHQVIVANNLREGVMLYVFWQPVDVVMTDIFISDINGFNFIAQMIRRGQEWEVDQRAEAVAMSDNRQIHNETVMFGVIRRLDVEEIMERSFYRHALRNKLAVILLSMEDSEGREPTTSFWNRYE